MRALLLLQLRTGWKGLAGWALAWTCLVAPRAARAPPPRSRAAAALTGLPTTRPSISSIESQPTITSASCGAVEAATAGGLGPGRLDDLASGVFAQPALAPLPRVAGNLVAADDVEYGIASFGLMSGPNECVVRGGGTIDATHNHVVMLESHDPYLRLSVSRRIIVDVSPLLKICSRVSRTATGRQASHRMDESGSNGAPDAGNVA